MSEAKLRRDMVMHGKSLFERGYTAGGSGNISVRTGDGGMLLTPTNSCLGRLEAEAIAKLDREGSHLAGDKPSKESVLHQAVYLARPDAGAVVHLHSPQAVAVSCLRGLDPANVLPPLTPYFVMRIGRLACAPYFPPGEPAMARAMAELASQYSAVLLAHHGIVVAGSDLQGAVYAAEELEETARLFLLLRGQDHEALSPEQVKELEERFGG